MAKKAANAADPARSPRVLLQVRTRALNGEWEKVFRRWYPGFRPQPQSVVA